MAAPDFPEIELALTSTALAGDAGGLYRIVSNLMDEGVPFDSLLFDYLMATERSVGQRWAQGDYLIAEEHAVTAAIETVISLLAGSLDQPSEGALVVVATAEGDRHSLPARAVAAHLLYLGYRTTFLGADVPAPDLAEFLEVEPPAALVMSVAMTTHLLGAKAVVEAAHQVSVPVLVGGKAFGPGGVWVDSVGADAWVDSLEKVAETVENWVVEGGPEAKAAVQLSEDLTHLIDNRTMIRARAFQELGGGGSARLRDEVDLLLSAVEAALLTGDDQVTVDMMVWQEESLRAQGFDSDLVVSAVQAALDDLSEVGRLALARAARSRTD